MTRFDRVAVVVALLVATSGHAVAAELGSIARYLGATARTYDANGQATGERPVAELPPPNSPIIAIDGNRHVVASKGGTLFYLKASDLVVSGGKSTCKPLVVSNNAYETHVTASAGVHAGAAENAVACTR